MSLFTWFVRWQECRVTVGVVTCTWRGRADVVLSTVSAGGELKLRCGSGAPAAGRDRPGAAAPSSTAPAAAAVAAPDAG